MKRRLFLQSIPSLFCGPPLALAQPRPWTIKVIDGGFDGVFFEAGLHLKMDKGWKTYWRVPGEGGVPPSILEAGGSLAEIAFDCPLPARLSIGAEKIIGYQNEVVFPIRMRPAILPASAPVTLDIFLGVCEQICIPVSLREQFHLNTSSRPLPDRELLQNWKARVPPKIDADGPVQSASLGHNTKNITLELVLSQSVDDIFVEADPSLYVEAPKFSGNGRNATLEVKGTQAESGLRGKSIRLTLVQQGAGLEQNVTVI
jgi:DsbC/DsbD-like thiol-disulfide interchange protein